ncbi:MAG: geranylgeranylglyceryl/heptaprenylglyceryl phosphate synthase [Bacteroidetes bacterium]|nr:MAG: geranylgeranylglyceryl/heptaprenylglyceryl phosphate synthase [Bacteroidota bacterium]
MNPRLISQFDERRSSGRKSFAVLIDPDKASPALLAGLLARAEAAGVDFLMLGGSLTVQPNIQELAVFIKKHSPLPLVLFPGSPTQITPEADAILFLSLISGRNADLLIGRHVEAAPLLKKTSLEILPTGYMLIEAGKMTTVNYISHTFPIPHDKPELAACTAMAGEMLGLRLIYMDGGSGALQTVSSEMIRVVSASIQIPLIVGGGIRSAQEAARIWQAGADIIVIGTALETDPSGGLIQEIGATRDALHAGKIYHPNWRG